MVHGYSPRLATAFWKKIDTAAGLSPSSPCKSSKTCATAPSDYAFGVTSAGEVDHRSIIWFFCKTIPAGIGLGPCSARSQYAMGFIEKRVLVGLCLYHFQHCAVVIGSLSY
jgi:hypothetical protein